MVKPNTPFHQYFFSADTSRYHFNALPYQAHPPYTSDPWFPAFPARYFQPRRTSLSGSGTMPCLAGYRIPGTMSNHTLSLISPITAAQRERNAAAAASTSDDAVIMAHFLAGDDAAFAELFDRHNHRLYVYCLKLVGDTAQAEDLTQEMWERVIRMRRSPQEVHTPIAFFLRILRNLCINHVKRTRRTVSLATLPESALPMEERRERSEMEDMVDQALAYLPFEYREVLVLNAYCGYRFDEIATMMGKSPEAIWMRASRARARLREKVMNMRKAGAVEMGYDSARHEANLEAYS